MADLQANDRSRNFKDLTGQVFGRLTVIEFAGMTICGRCTWRCMCGCGMECVVRRDNLISGNTLSCGCLRREMMTSHDMTTASEYGIWKTMKQRCNNPKYQPYRYYGGRGITVCDRWLNSFENFFQDMGPRPSMKHTIERRDNDAGYYPENCCWATRQEQMNNTRMNRILTHEGMSLTVAQWAERLGIHRNTIGNRLRLGWTINDTLTQPLRPGRNGRAHGRPGSSMTG